MKILIIKPSSFGDIVQSNPVLTALRKEYEGCEISWLVFDTWKDVITLFPDVNHAIVWKKKKSFRSFFSLVKLLRKERFDIVIDLQGLIRTSLLSLLTGAKKRIAVPGMKEFSNLFTREAYPESSGMHAVERSLETVRFLSGKRHEPSFNITIPENAAEGLTSLLKEQKISAGDKIIGIVPSVRGKGKQWPAPYYKELINFILEKLPEAWIVILGSVNKSLVFDRQEVADLRGKTSILHLAGMLKLCNIVVGGDTGPIHLASAMKIPTVAIFGGSDVKETSPLGTHVSVIRKNYKCSPCRSRPQCKDYPCLGDITPEEVFAVVRRRIRESSIH